MRIASPGTAAFAATLVALGIAGLIKGDLNGVWEGVAAGAWGREGLAYLCALISLACGAGLFWQRSAPVAARVLLAALLLWWLIFKLPDALRAPLTAVSWESLGETTVIVAAAWVLYASLATDRDRQRLGFATGAQGVRIAQVLYGLAMIAFGQAHQMGLFTLLVWVPVLAAGSQDPEQWSEGIVSWALTASGWVVADSYRRVRPALSAPRL
jgi:hypothetical protein